MNVTCKCPLSAECNAKRGYFDCARKLLKLVEEKFDHTNLLIELIGIRNDVECGGVSSRKVAIDRLNAVIAQLL